MGRELELAARELRRACDPASLGFETTAGLPLLSEVLGQPRAVAALEFGARIGSPGFNLFALGQPGSGRTTLIKDYLEQYAATQPPPPDLCYVYNFADTRRPLPLNLPAGRAVQFKQDMEALLEELQTEIPKAFETGEYTSHRDQVLQQLDAQRREKLAQIDRHATESGFKLLKGPGGLMLAPAVGEKLLSDEDLERLKVEEREKVTQARDRLQHEIEERLRSVRELEKGMRDALRALDTDTAVYATRHVIEDLRSLYRDLPAVLDYLTAVQADVTAHADEFRKGKASRFGAADADR